MKTVEWAVEHGSSERARRKTKKDCGKLDDDVKRHLNVNLCRRANSKKGASM